MKAVASIAVSLGFLSFAAAQAGSLVPSPTQSVGCVAHGDHWDCEAPRVTSAAVLTTTVSGVAVTTTLAAGHDDHDHTHDDDHDEDDHSSHTDEPGAGSLKPSPTESYGCESHGDHWHCEGKVGATSSLIIATTGTTTSTGAVAGGATPTGAATRSQAAGLGLMAAALVMAL
ncbi:hypothetical protein OQA88_3512 [Cercophora sp. LCS_1]